MEVEDIERLIEDHGDIIYKFCIKLTQNKEDGEDLFQQTFLKATEGKSKIDINNNILSYLVSISIGLWKNTKRKKKRRDIIAPVVNIYKREHLEIIDYSVNIEANVINNEKERVLNNIISKLKFKYRMPVIMYYTANMSLDDISKFLSIPKGTVKSRLYKARQIIREELEKMGYKSA